jgi:hypothetical protein
MVNSAAVTNTHPYYGPAKRYQYWYTGENTEILDFSQTFNNSYFMALGLPLPNGASDSIAASTASTTVGQPTSQSSTNTLGVGAEAVGSYKGALYEGAAYVNASIRILGDPDYLSIDSAFTADKFSASYGPNGYTINPNSGQIFIEINFNEGKDYNTNNSSSGTGLMSINDKVLFQPYTDEQSSNIPKDVNGNPVIQGISYQISNVISTFSSGAFTQTLGLVLNQFTGTSTGDQGAANSNTATAAANPGPARSNASDQSNNTGLLSAKRTDNQKTGPQSSGNTPVVKQTTAPLRPSEHTT